MTEGTPRHQRHHKEHNVRREKQMHGGGGRLHEEGEGLQLPRFGPSWYLGFPFLIYPKGWTFRWLTPGRAALLFGGGFFALMVLCIACCVSRWQSCSLLSRG
jgi:hypothetical protein